MLETQLDQLREALAWLKLRQADIEHVSMGKHPAPVIRIALGRACTALRLQKRYAATTSGRAWRAGEERITWQATLHGCKVIWTEPTQFTVPV